MSEAKAEPIFFSGHYEESMFPQSLQDKFDSGVISRLMNRYQTNGGQPLTKAEFTEETTK